MSKPYLILVNGVLAARHTTRRGALKHMERLQAKGIQSVIAYAIGEDFTLCR